MGISIFPSTAAEFVSNNFVVDMNDTTNNTADTGGIKQAGPYSMSFSSGDSSFDVYLIDEDGNSVGYSNNTSIVASGLFTTVVILGVPQDEVISFLYQGSVNNADGEGDEPGAGAYLTSITPSDLPSIDDTATVIGGNFGTATEFTFESGTVVLAAKNASIISGTEALLTRPDELIEDDAPYDLKAINPGVTPPTSVDFVLSGTVTAGSDPTWVTTSPLNSAAPGVAFSQTLEATDSEGAVVDYSVTSGTITPGLTLDSSTGVLSGTPTTGGSFTFTVTATDDGGNTTPKEFDQSVLLATGGTISDDGGFRYHTFTSSDDFEALVELTDAEYLVVAGGGGGGGITSFNSSAGSGGGAGGLLSGTATIPVGTVTCTIGAGGGVDANGNNTQFGSIATAIGGGSGGFSKGGSGSEGGDGGSGGGGDPVGTGTSGQGNNGGLDQSNGTAGGGGGGASGVGGGSTGVSGGGNGGIGESQSVFATATSTGDGGRYAGGGGGGHYENEGGTGGTGGGGDGGQGRFTITAPEPGQANTGGGGGGGARNGADGGSFSGAAGGSGIVIVRYAF